MPAISATWIASALLAAFSTHIGQVSRKPDIRMDVDLVLVPVTVVDRNGASVTGLERGDFRVYEDKVQQSIVSFASEDAPVSLGVVFDLSGSMKNKIAEAKAAGRALFQTAGEADEAFLITFAGRPEIRSAFTNDFPALLGSIAAGRVHGSTALVDAVYAGLTRMRGARHARKALVVISDGQDNHSRYTRAELKSLALESDVQIHTVGLFQARRAAKALELSQERAGLVMLEDLSRSTGGLHFALSEAGDIARTAERIGTALRNLYVIGYRPTAGGEGYRRIQVKATQPHLRVHSRAGYYAAPSMSREKDSRILRP